MHRQGLFTLMLGLLAFLLLPPSVTQTASWARGKKGWFTARYLLGSAVVPYLKNC